MVTFYDDISKDHADWIRKQKIFFVGTSPLDASGRVNVSPKGHDAFRVLGPNKVCYLELTGSGIETLAAVKENGRLTIMFTAFTGAPRIMRLWTNGHVLENGTPEFQKLFDEQYRESSDMAQMSGIRSIIVGDVYQVSSSCGFAVPYFDYKEDRQTLASFWGKRSEEDIEKYWYERNNLSLDGLPGMRNDPADFKKKQKRIKAVKDGATVLTAFTAGFAVALVAVKYFNLRQ